MTLPHMAIFIALLGCAVFAFGKLLASLGIGGKPIPRVERADLMTKAERRVIAYVEAALPRARIHAQVSMGALMKPARGLDRRTSTITRNRFSSKRVDFVAEDRETGAIIAIIELDDRTHNASNDRWRDNLTSSAGYKTIRLPAGEHHTHETVRNRILHSLSNPAK